MKSKLNEKWNDFVKKIQREETELILFGASSCADIFLNRLEKNFKVNVRYIIDNDINKQGKVIWDYPVFGIDKLKDANAEDVLLITSTYHQEIIEQLNEINFPGEVYSYLHLRDKIMELDSMLNSEELVEKISQLKDLCGDEKSKDIVDRIIYKRKNGISDYSDICSPNQYFVEGLMKPEKDEVFIDGGSYDGATIEDFFTFATEGVKRVYAFEMDQANYDKINKEFFNDKVTFYNYALWNQRDTISFIENERGSEVAEDGASNATCVALDELIKEEVTFIKMDIEGAELKALMGAKRIITHDKPKLAICLYHKFNDLWEIPFYIHELVPEYNFAIRHHANNKEETVLYAYI